MNNFIEYKSDTAKGFQAMIETPKGKANMVMIIQCNYNVAVPYFYASDRRGDDAAMPAVEKAFLEQVISAQSDLIKPDIKEWSETTIFWEQLLEKAVRNVTSATIELARNKNFTIEPCYEVGEPVYYLVNSDVVQSGESLYQIAADVTNYEKNEKVLQTSKDKLQEFYDKEIRPFADRTDLTAEQKETLQENYSTFSDWHKDVYGHRPYNDRNECKKPKPKKSQMERD